MSAFEFDEDNPSKYEILGRLGRGGMGEVYKARHRLLDEVRAIKVMRTAGAGHSTRVERFFREARIASTLDHPHIAKLFDFALARDGRAFMVLEWVDGVNLREWLRASGPPPLEWVLEVARQSLDALAYMHDRGIVHRDISPDNLMISTAGVRIKVKLIDLGVAKRIASVDGLTDDGQFLGKLRYAPPEAFVRASSADLDHRADLYSMGVVLYELLTGTYPFEADSREGLIAAQISDSPRSFDDTDPEGRITPKLRSVVLQALEKDPDRRPDSARELAANLDAAERQMTLPSLPAASDEVQTLVAPTGVLESDADIQKTQQELDRHFPAREAESPEGSSEAHTDEVEADEQGAESLVALEEASSQKEYSSLGSTIIRSMRDHPVSATLLGLLLAVVPFVIVVASRTTSGAVSPQTPDNALEPVAIEQPLAQEPAGPGIVTRSQTPEQATISIIDSTSGVAARLLPFLSATEREVTVTGSLQEAMALAPDGADALAVQLDLERSTGVGEAYDTALPFCDVSGSLLVVHLPELTPLASRSASQREPTCSEAESAVIRRLGSQVAAILSQADL